jgi:hypothetical protein
LEERVSQILTLQRMNYAMDFPLEIETQTISQRQNHEERTSGRIEQGK